MQRGVPVIAKSSNPKRLRENLEVSLGLGLGFPATLSQLYVRLHMLPMPCSHGPNRCRLSRPVRVRAGLRGREGGKGRAAHVHTPAWC